MAHHSDDNLETVIFRLTRGTGMRGLCGIPPVRYEHEIKVIRPLIESVRDDIINMPKIAKFHLLPTVQTAMKNIRETVFASLLYRSLRKSTRGGLFCYKNVALLFGKLRSS